MALEFARLLTGKYRSKEVFNAFEDLSDDNISPEGLLNLLENLDDRYISPNGLLGFLMVSIKSNVLREMAISLVENVRTFASSALGKEILRHTFPKVAKPVVGAFLTDDDEEKQSRFLFQAVQRLVGALLLVKSPTRPVAFLKPEELFVSQIERPFVGQEIFPTSFNFSAPVKQEGDFPIHGLFSENDLELDNHELFYHLTRQTSSGLSMTFEEQFKRHVAWHLGGVEFEETLRPFETSNNTFFKTPKGVPKGWPGWSPLGGVLMSLDNYLKAFYNLSLIFPKDASQDLRAVAKKVFYQQRSLWVLRHLAFFQTNHTYLSFSPYLEKIKEDLQLAGSFETSVPKNATIRDFVPESIIKILNQTIGNYDSQGRYFTAFTGQLDRKEDPLEEVAKISYVALARIVVSSEEKDKPDALNDPIFAQQVAKDISDNIRNYLGRMLGYNASPASSSSLLAELVSVVPNVVPFLQSLKGTGLENLEKSMVQTSSVDVSKKLNLERSLLKAGYSDSFIWAIDSLLANIGRVEPLRVVTGSFAGVPVQEESDTNAGYVLSCLAARLSTQTYFRDDNSQPALRDAALYRLTSKYLWNLVYPRGFYQASEDLLGVADLLAEIAPLDGIESKVSTLQEFAGQRVTMTSGGSAFGINTVSLDAERYPIFDMLHSGFVGYRVPFGRCWSWIRHTMLRRGPEIVQNDNLFRLAVRSSFDTKPSWTWLLANGTQDALKKVREISQKAHVLLESDTGFLKLDFGVIKGLPDAFDDRVHPASLLMFYISGNIDLEFDQTEDIYNEKTADLMAFIVRERLTTTSINDLGVDLFTDNLLFHPLRILTEAMIQHLEHKEMVDLAQTTPLGRFVVQAARKVRTDEPDILDEETLETKQKQIAAFNEEIRERITQAESRTNLSESYQERFRQKYALSLNKNRIYDQVRVARMRGVASTVSGVEQALAFIDKASETVKPLDFDRSFYVPIYAIAPERQNLGAVSDGFAEQDGALFGYADAVFAGVYAQREPKLFAKEVERAILLAREKVGGPTLNALELKSVKELLSLTCEKIFSLGALLSAAEKPKNVAGSSADSNPESLQELLEVSKQLVGGGFLEGANLDGTEPLYRLYPQEPFDFSLDTIINLALILLKELKRALKMRLVNRMPGTKGLTALEQESLGPLETNALYLYELNEMPVSPLIRQWIGGQYPEKTTETWKGIHLIAKPVVSESSEMVEIGQKISPLTPNLDYPDGLLEDERERYIEYAETLAYLYDRLFTDRFGELSFSELFFEIYKVVLGTSIIEKTGGTGSGWVSTQFKALIDVLSGLPTTLVSSLERVVGQGEPTFQNVEQWLLENTEASGQLDRFLEKAGFWELRQLLEKRDFAFTAVPQNATATGNILLYIEMIQMYKAIQKLLETSFTGSSDFTESVNALRQVFQNFVLSLQSFTYDRAVNAQFWIPRRYLFEFGPDSFKRYVMTGEHLADSPERPIPLPEIAGPSDLSLEDAFNQSFRGYESDEKTTQTARFAFWSAKVRLVTYMAARIGPQEVKESMENSPEFESYHILWPWLTFSAQRFKDVYSNYRDDIGLSDTFVEGLGWVNNQFIDLGNHIASTFVSLLYKELEVVKELDTGHLIWPQDVTVDAIVFFLTTKTQEFNTLPPVKAALRDKDYNRAQTYGQHMGRVYTVADQLLVLNYQKFDARFSGFNASSVALELLRVRKGMLYQNNFYETTESITWDGLENLEVTGLPEGETVEKRYFGKESFPKHRYKPLKFNAKKRSNIKTEPEFLDVAIYRQVQSCYNAAHAYSILLEFDSVTKINNFQDEPIAVFEREGESVSEKRLVIQNLLVLVAGMMRPTEPLFIRSHDGESNFYGVWMDGEEPVIIKRIKELLAGVDNKSLSQFAPGKVKSRSSSNTKVPSYGISEPNQDEVSQRPSDQELNAISESLGGTSEFQVEFSKYAKTGTVLETYGMLNFDQMSAFLEKITNLTAVVINLDKPIQKNVTRKGQSTYGALATTRKKIFGKEDIFSGFGTSSTYLSSSSEDSYDSPPATSIFDFAPLELPSRSPSPVPMLTNLPSSTDPLPMSTTTSALDNQTTSTTSTTRSTGSNPYPAEDFSMHLQPLPLYPQTGHITLPGDALSLPYGKRGLKYVSASEPPTKRLANLRGLPVAQGLDLFGTSEPSSSSSLSGSQEEDPSGFYDSFFELLNRGKPTDSHGLPYQSYDRPRSLFDDAL